MNRKILAALLLATLATTGCATWFDQGRQAQQSIDLFKLAGMPTDLHLVSGIDHFIFSDDSTLVLNVVKDWLEKFFPLQAPTQQAVAA